MDTHRYLTLIDCGATASFMDKQEADFHHADKIMPLTRPIPLSLFDGELSSGGWLTHYISTEIEFEDGTKSLVKFYLTKLHPSAKLVLGFPWLRKANPQIDWAELTYRFSSGITLRASILPESTLPSLKSRTKIHVEEVEDEEKYI